MSRKDGVGKESGASPGAQYITRRVFGRMMAGHAMEYAAGGLLAVALGYHVVKRGTDLPFSTPHPPLAPTNPTPVPNPDLIKEQIILDAAQRLGVTKSDEEIALLQGSFEYSPTDSIAISETNLTLGEERVQNARQMMPASSNDFFRKSEDYLRYLESDRGLISIWSLQSMADLSMRSLLLPDPARAAVVPAISWGLDYVLNGTSDKILANAITLAATRLKRYVNYLDSIPPNLNDPLDYLNRQELYLQHYSTQAQAYIENLAVYEVIAKAYITEAGLLGQAYDMGITGYDDVAAAYILSGSNPNDPRWRDFVIKVTNKFQ